MQKTRIEERSSQQISPENIILHLFKEHRQLLNRPSRMSNIYSQRLSDLYRLDYFPLMKSVEELWESKWKQASTDILELVDVEFEKRFSETLPTIRQIAMEAAKLQIKEETEEKISLLKGEIKKLNEIMTLELLSPKERTDFDEALNELKQNILKSSLPNPKIFFKQLDSQKTIHVIIDDSDKYVDYLLEFSEIVTKLQTRYDIDMEILLFENREIKVPLEKTGFKKA